MDKLLIAGICFLGAAVIGGGLKAFEINVPAINSIPRQVALGILGVFFLWAGWPRENLTPQPISPKAEPTVAAPFAPSINIPSDVRFIGEKLFEIAVEPGKTQALLDLAEIPDTGSPPCASLILHFSWQVRDPYPPEGVKIIFHGERQQNRRTLGETPAGSNFIGCEGVSLENLSPRKVTVSIRSSLGERRE